MEREVDFGRLNVGLQHGAGRVRRGGGGDGRGGRGGGRRGGGRGGAVELVVQVVVVVDGVVVCVAVVFAACDDVYEVGVAVVHVQVSLIVH